MSTIVTLITVMLAAVVIAAAAALVFLLIPRAISAWRLDRRARQHYRIARGTQHLKQLEDPLSRLKRDIAATESQIRHTRRELRELKSKRKGDLRRALSKHLVAERLTEVHGIGPRLQQRIIRQCFRGELRDLHRADNLFNIGPTRQAALTRWVRARERELPRLLEASFPGKEAINKRYGAKKVSLDEQLDRARRQLAEKQALLAPADKTRSKLKSVQVSSFTKALRDREPNIYVPESYLTGVYAPWESPPDWFVILINRYGD